MPTYATAHLPRPKSGDEFQSIVIDALRVRWSSPDFQENGRSGQAQRGVDGYGSDDLGQLVGVQCKKRWKEHLSISAIEAEVRDADAFEPPLARFYIATSTDRDARVQRAVRLLSEERVRAGKSPVGVLFWDDIVGDLTKDERLVAKHWPQLVRRQEHKQDPSALLVALRRLYAKAEELNRESHNAAYVDPMRLIDARLDASLVRKHLELLQPSDSTMTYHLDLVDGVVDACDALNRMQESLPGGVYEDLTTRIRALRERVPNIVLTTGTAISYFASMMNRPQDSPNR